MVETKPPQPGQSPQPEAAKSLQLPSAALGFDFVSFLIAVFVISLLSTGAVFAYRFLIIGRTITEQEQQIQSLRSELSGPKLQQLEKKAEEISGGIEKIRPILEEKIRLAELFWTLRKVTEKQVRWRSLGFNETKLLSLTGEAASWGNVARQLAMLKQSDKFSRVELAGASVEPTGGSIRINFSVMAQVNTDKLIPPEAQTVGSAGF